MRTISPLGSWYGMIFSEEMYNAMKFGYKFEVLWGYTFNSSIIFDNYVNDIYKMRLTYPKTDPMNYIAKLLLNSLYGRFGMNDDFVYSAIIPQNDLNEYEKSVGKENIIDVIEMDDNYIVQSKIKNRYLELNDPKNVNVGISAAITAYSRIFMSQFKNNPNYKLYYSDTDSIFIDRPLEAEIISSTILGKMKLERICKDAIFLAPKVYALKEENGTEIIKIKGLTANVISNLSFSDLEELLHKDSSREFSQAKWFRSITEGNISIKNQEYTLRVTNNKRELIYDNDLLVNTRPFTINDENQITKK